MARTYAGPIFAHRHYAELAKIIATTDTREEMTAAMVALFARDNPKFDRARFADAANGTPKGKDKR